MVSLGDIHFIILIKIPLNISKLPKYIKTVRYLSTEYIEEEAVLTLKLKLISGKSVNIWCHGCFR